LTEVVTQITKSVTDIAENGVGDKELKKAKAYAAGNFLLSHETTDSVARDIAKQAILDERIEKPNEYTERLQNVTAKEVKNAACSILEKDLQAVAIGPDSDKQAVESVLS